MVSPDCCFAQLEPSVGMVTRWLGLGHGRATCEPAMLHCQIYKYSYALPTTVEPDTNPWSAEAENMVDLTTDWGKWWHWVLDQLSVAVHHAMPRQNVSLSCKIPWWSIFFVLILVFSILVRHLERKGHGKRSRC